MSVLTPDQISVTQHYVDLLLEDIHSRGLRVKIDDDLAFLRDYLDSAPKGEELSNTIHPDMNAIPAGHAFWIGFLDSIGSIVCTVAVRHIESDDFVNQYVGTHLLFGNRVPILNMYPIDFVETVPVLSGKLAFGAAGWVHPDWRGQELYGVMSRLGRALGLRHFALDYYIGFTAQTNSAQKSWDWPNSRFLSTGRYPGRDKDLNVNIVWASKDEMLSQFGHALSENGGLQRVG